ncbi:MAG TPA: hypothetical protein VK629_11400, partial [Steroidobacteraceae bacterium]|nr:hypothetical protein [Steroidobacteraceae bacterium]
LLVTAGDVTEMATALATLLDANHGASARARFQQGARLAAQNLPTWSATAELIASLIRELQSQ